MGFWAVIGLTWSLWSWAWCETSYHICYLFFSAIFSCLSMVWSKWMVELVLFIFFQWAGQEERCHGGEQCVRQWGYWWVIESGEEGRRTRGGWCSARRWYKWFACAGRVGEQMGQGFLNKGIARIRGGAFRVGVWDRLKRKCSYWVGDRGGVGAKVIWGIESRRMARAGVK